MWFTPWAFLLLWFAPVFFGSAKGTRLRRFLQLKTTLEVGADHLKCSNAKRFPIFSDDEMDRANAIELHFEDIIEFQTKSQKGVNYLAANLSGKSWQTLVSDLGGFSVTEIESATQYCQSQLRDYQARTNQPHIATSLDQNENRAGASR